MIVSVEPPALDEDSQYLMYPDRERCRRCRSPFGDLVINRLYCSYPCAKKKEPDPDVRNWPRDCRTRTNEPKVRYFYPGAVSATPGTTIRVYHCSYCGMYHIGHSDPEAPHGNAPAHRRSVPAQRRRKSHP